MPEQTAPDPVIAVGQWVGVDDAKWPGRWRITKVNKTTVDLDQPGRARGLRAHKWMLTAPPAEQAPGQVGTDYVPAPVFPAGFRTGSIFRLTAKAEPRYRNIPAGTWLVAFGDKGDHMNSTFVGGHPERRYWRVRPGDVGEVLDVATLNLPA